tara:strand:- start:451 stop:654 length:204 start_codon:yes stop_codon:yes gene_type:complete
MEKRLDREQYVKDLEKHIDKLADHLVKARTLLELSLTVISPADDTTGVKDSIEDYLYGATRNYVDQD